MKEYGKQYSSIKPEPVKYTENEVYTYNNIVEITKHDYYTNKDYIEYEFDFIVYSKDEYMQFLDKQITEAQLALCELYELSNK